MYSGTVFKYFCWKVDKTDTNIDFLSFYDFTVSKNLSFQRVKYLKFHLMDKNRNFFFCGNF